MYNVDICRFLSSYTWFGVLSRQRVVLYHLLRVLFLSSICKRLLIFLPETRSTSAVPFERYFYPTYWLLTAPRGSYLSQLQGQSYIRYLLVRQFFSRGFICEIQCEKSAVLDKRFRMKVPHLYYLGCC